jgi:hypothetical protein
MNTVSNLTIPTQDGPIDIDVRDVIEYHQEKKGVEIKMKGQLPTYPVTIHCTLNLIEFEKRFEQVKKIADNL